MDASSYDVSDKLEFWIDTDFSFAAFETMEDEWLTHNFQMNIISTIEKLQGQHLETF